jgi:hypothetical protein
MFNNYYAHSVLSVGLFTRQRLETIKIKKYKEHSSPKLDIKKLFRDIGYDNSCDPADFVDYLNQET